MLLSDSPVTSVWPNATVTSVSLFIYLFSISIWQSWSFLSSWNTFTGFPRHHSLLVIVLNFSDCSFHHLCLFLLIEVLPRHHFVFLLHLYSLLLLKDSPSDVYGTLWNITALKYSLYVDTFRIYIFKCSLSFEPWTLCPYVIWICVFKFFEKIFCLFLYRGEGREKGRETSVCGCLSHAPYWGPGLQPMLVPWLGIERVTLWFAGLHSVQWATPAREVLPFFNAST